jgi:hypothetical protein
VAVQRLSSAAENLSYGSGCIQFLCQYFPSLPLCVTQCPNSIAKKEEGKGYFCTNLVRYCCPCASHQCIRGCEVTATIIVNLSTRWRRVVSFTPRPLYLWGKSSQHPPQKRLCGPQTHSGSFERLYLCWG